MDSVPSCLSLFSIQDNIFPKENNEECVTPMVDSFLIEALQNPRHRVTVLRMELDIQKFMQDPEKHQFEFQHFPTSYLRLAAHRVAQHYNLQSMVVDKHIDGSVGRIIVKKTNESKYPSIRLSDIPVNQSETETSEQVKIAIRLRPHRPSQNDLTELRRQSPVRSVEERKEEYDRARARIFNGFSTLESEDTPQSSPHGKISFSNRDVNPGERNLANGFEKPVSEDVGTNRVAILRDREKDRSDPDYDRSYDRYFKGSTSSCYLNLTTVSNLPPPFTPLPSSSSPLFLSCEPNFTQLCQLPRAQPSVSYLAPNLINHFSTSGVSQTSRDTGYVHWPTPATMMYAHSFEHFRHSMFQVPFYQQPLGFDYLQKH